MNNCKADHSISVNNISLQAINIFLCKNRQAEDLSRINELSKKCKSAKRKRTPNVTRANDAIRILIGLQDYDIFRKIVKQAEID